MAKPKSAESILRNIKKQKFEPKNPIATEMFLPNHSGVKNHREILNNYVPYTGAINNVDLGSKNFTTTGTITGEHLTSTDDLTVQGHAVTFGDGTDTEFDILFNGNTYDKTLTYKGEFGVITFDGDFSPYEISAGLGGISTSGAIQGTTTNQKIIYSDNGTLAASQIAQETASPYRLSVGTGIFVSPLFVNREYLSFSALSAGAITGSSITTAGTGTFGAVDVDNLNLNTNMITSDTDTLTLKATDQGFADGISLVYDDNTGDSTLQAGEGAFVISANAVNTGIVTATGNITIGQDLIHYGDADTYLRFTNNQIVLQAGGTDLFTLGTNSLVLLSGIEDANLTIQGEMKNAMVYDWGNDIFNFSSDISSNSDITTTGTIKGGNYESGDGSAGITQSETGVTDFDIVIKDGLITSFTKN